MKNLNIQIEVSADTYIKDPSSSSLGKKILSNGIILIHDLGFEAFTFKKLGVKIGSPESSIYRYFENKQMFLSYLTTWYWSWVEYKLVFSLSGIPQPKERLEKAIHIITDKVVEDNQFSHINEVILDQIIMEESAKTYYTREVDKKNEKGYFTVYKRVVQRISDLILEVNSNFKFPHTLITTVIEGSHQQRFFTRHLPTLTDFKEDNKMLPAFFNQLVFKTISTYEQD
jgi:hypothetical protein